MSFRLCAYQYCNAQTYMDIYSAQTAEQKIKVAQIEQLVELKSDREHIQVSSLCLKKDIYIQITLSLASLQTSHSICRTCCLLSKLQFVVAELWLLLHYFDVYDRQRRETLQIIFCVEHKMAISAFFIWKFVKLASF